MVFLKKASWGSQGPGEYHAVTYAVNDGGYKVIVQAMVVAALNAC